MHDVSPMKYLPSTKMIDNSRYKKHSISFGFGLRPNLKEIEQTPGPGDYTLPNVFEKRKNGRLPLN
jgi:hypothetical protein